MSDLLNSLVGGLRDGSLYGLLALGIVLVYQTTGVLSFALGNVGLIAALTLHSLTATALPYWLDLALSLVGGAALGLLLERAFVRPASAAPPISLTIVTLAIFTLLQGVAFQIWGATTSATLIPPFDTTSRELGASGVYLAPLDLASWLAGPLLAGGLYLFLRSTRLGIAMRASADQPEAARLVGIRPGLVGAIAWGLGGLLATVSAILIAANLPGLGATFMLEPLVWAVLAAALGGLASLPGALAAGLLIGVLDQVLQTPLGPLDLTAYHRSILFTLFLALLLARRGGLFAGSRLRSV